MVQSYFFIRFLMLGESLFEIAFSTIHTQNEFKKWLVSRDGYNQHSILKLLIHIINNMIRIRIIFQLI